LRFRLEDGICKPGIVQKEIRQLLNGDIPIFTARPAPPRPVLNKGDFDQAIENLRGALHAVKHEV
jgi:hypothetical protein